MKTASGMEKQQNPNNSGGITSSHSLRTAQLVFRRRYDSNTRNESGATVCAVASGMNFVLKVGRCFITTTLPSFPALSNTDAVSYGAIVQVRTSGRARVNVPRYTLHGVVGVRRVWFA